LALAVAPAGVGAAEVAAWVWEVEPYWTPLPNAMPSSTAPIFFRLPLQGGDRAARIDRIDMAEGSNFVPNAYQFRGHTADAATTQKPSCGAEQLRGRRLNQAKIGAALGVAKC